MILSLSMKPLVRNVFGLLAALAVSFPAGAAVDLQTLVDRSPFAPPGQQAETAAPAEQATLEFRGVVTDDGGTSYSIFDTTTNKGRWVRAEDENSPIRVKGYDAANGLLEVEQNGRPVKLTLKRATIQAGQPVAAMAAAPAPVVNGPVNPGEVRRTEGGADARRLEAVAAEVRRRRALRNASRAQQGQPPAAPAPATAPAPAPAPSP